MPQRVPSFTAVYELDSPPATMTVQVTSKSGTVVYDSNINSDGLLGKPFAGKVTSHSSAYRNNGGVLLPLQYNYSVEKQPEREQHYRFDWTQKQATAKHKSKEYVVELTDDVLDENILLLRLAEDIGTLGTHFDKTYRILTRGRVKQRHFFAVGREQLATKLGNLDTIKVERRKRDTVDRVLWLSNTHYFLPVKVEWLEEGRIKQTLSVLELRTS